MNLRQQLAEAMIPNVLGYVWIDPASGEQRYIDPAEIQIACREPLADVTLAVFAAWLREQAESQRFIAENGPHPDLASVALFGGARAALNALADEIERTETNQP